MSDEKKPIVIRTKNGKEIDLARIHEMLEKRAELGGKIRFGDDAIIAALLDALEGALSANQYQSCCCMQEVHRAAGVVE